MPAWRRGLAVGQWQQVPGTALASAPMAVPTYPGLGYGPKSKVIAWTGFALDTRDSSVYSAANGGHTDYAGNEVNRIRLSDNAPVWTEPRASTPISQVVPDVDHYADGRPTSRHSYYGATVNEQRNRVMVLGGSRWGIGWVLGSVDGFDLGVNDWDAARTYPDGLSELGSTPGPAIVEQKSTGDIFVFANWNVLRWSNSSNSWSRVISNGSIYGQYAATAVDTRRNRILLVGGNANDRAIYNPATNTAQTITLSGPNAGALSDSGNGMVYDPLLDAFLVRTREAGGTIYRINAQTFSVDILPTTGTAQPAAAMNGVWRRFLYVPQLKGIVYFPTYDEGMWFLRTS